MAIGSGLGSSFGMAPEVTYGTYVAPTRFLEGTAALTKSKQIYQGGGMAAGRMVQPGGRRYVTSRSAGGSFATTVFSKNMGLLLNGIMGGTVTPVQQGATTAYLQTHTLGDPFGKFFTMQSGIPDLGGTARPYTFLGCQVVAAEFSCELNGALTCSFEVEARDVTEAQTLAAPSYPVVNEFHFAQAALKLGTYGAEAAVDGVRSMSLRLERRRHDGGPYMGSGGLRSQGVMNDWTKVSGTIQADYLTKADFADRFASDDDTSLVWEFVGPTIEGAEAETIRFTVPMVFLDGDTPTADGPDVVRTSYPWVGQHDGTNSPLTIEYISTDIAI